MVTPHEYFKTDIIVNQNNINTFRNLYRTLSKIDTFDGHDIDETSLINAAQQLHIQADLDDHRKLLCECVKREDMENTLLSVGVSIAGSVQPISIILPPATAATTPQHSKYDVTAERSEEYERPTILSDIQCIITIKRRGKDIDDFLNTYLLQIVKKTNENEYVFFNREKLI